MRIAEGRRGMHSQLIQSPLHYIVQAFPCFTSLIDFHDAQIFFPEHHLTMKMHSLFLSCRNTIETLIRQDNKS